MYIYKGRLIHVYCRLEHILLIRSVLRRPGERQPVWSPQTQARLLAWLGALVAALPLRCLLPKCTRSHSKAPPGSPGAGRPLTISAQQNFPMRSATWKTFLAPRRGSGHALPPHPCGPSVSRDVPQPDTLSSSGDPRCLA